MWNAEFGLRNEIGEQVKWLRGEWVNGGKWKVESEKI
jgi:hypothetical protein